MRGPVENGQSGGGIAYGYTIQHQYDAQGQLRRGGREILEEQAQVIRRIFQEYAHENKPPKAITAPSMMKGLSLLQEKDGRKARLTAIVNVAPVS